MKSSEASMSKLVLARVLPLFAAGAAASLGLALGCSAANTTPGGTSPASDAGGETDTGSTTTDGGTDGSTDGGGTDGGNNDAGNGDGGDGGVLALEGPIATVAGGPRHTCAVYANGALACWGGNDNGQLGLGDTKDRGDSAAPLSALTRVDLGANVRVAEVSLGERHTCARLTTGMVKCWGSGGDGQLGLDSQAKRGVAPGEMGDNLPEVNLGAGRTAAQIVAGASHTCARLDNGTVKCWGRNSTGQLGLGDTKFRGEQSGQMAALPVVDLGTGRTAVEIGAGNAYTCARLDNGEVKCWGANGEGELGNGLGTGSIGFKGGQMGDSLVAVALGTGRTATALSVGFFHACAKLDNGKVKCWGANSAGQLGLGDQADRGTAGAQMGDNLPAVELGTGRTVTSVSVGQEFNCARLDDMSIKCWGNSFYGQLGYGNTQKLGDGAGEMGDNLLAVDLGAGLTAKVLGIGGEHVCALLDNGKVKCWGSNISAQLGNGTRNHVGDAPNEMGANLADTPLPQ